jgi:hypothetical protein
VSNQSTDRCVTDLQCSGQVPVKALAATKEESWLSGVDSRCICIESYTAGNRVTSHGGITKKEGLAGTQGDTVREGISAAVYRTSPLSSDKYDMPDV